MTPEVEEWRPVVGHEGTYEVSNAGRVRSLARTILKSNGVLHPFPARNLTPRLHHRQGYLSVALYGNGTRRERPIHILVAAAFIGPRPQGMDVCHANDVKTDNRVQNLRYGTRSENMQDAVRNRTHQASRKTHCLNGHEFTPENTYVWPARPTRRSCKTCSHDRSARYRAARMGKANA